MSHLKKAAVITTNGDCSSDDEGSDTAGCIYVDETNWTISLFAVINTANFIAFIKILEKLDARSSRKPARITVRLCSDGGDAFQGLAIYDAIKRCVHPVDTEAIGLVASAAAVIFAAGAIRSISPNAFLLVHQVHKCIFKEISNSDLKIEAKNTSLVHDRIASIFASLNGDDEQCAEMMSKETLLTAREALQLGLATALLTV